MAPKTKDGSAPKDKAGDFGRLAATRTQKAVKAIRTLQNVTNKASYSYTPAQVQKILGALLKEVEALKAAFDNGGKQAVEGFSL